MLAKSAAVRKFFLEVRRVKKTETVIENVVGKIDWLQVICQNITWIDIFEKLLGISQACVAKQEASLKHEKYDTLYSCGSIRYYTFANRSEGYERGTLVLSGQACTIYELAVSASQPDSFVLQDLAWRINECARDSEFTYEVKRLDLALDDYNEKPYFTVDQVIGKANRKQYLSKGRMFKVIDSEFDKKNRAKTLQIGAGGSSCKFRIYEKNKEMARHFTDVKRDEVMAQAPQVRLEAELRKDLASSLFQAIICLAEETELVYLIRGFIKTELTFYTDTTYKKVCRWWQAYLTPVKDVKIRRRYTIPNFEDSLYWYEKQGGQALTQAIYFMMSEGIGLPLPISITQKDDYKWTSELSEKMIDYVASNGRSDLIPVIQARTKKNESCQ